MKAYELSPGATTADIHNALIAALLSDDFTQCTGRLRADHPNPRAAFDGEKVHCCLGVACEIIMPLLSPGDSASAEYDMDTGIGVMPASVADLFEGGHNVVGDRAGDPNVNLGERDCHLSTWNDGGSSFAQIAAMIRDADWFKGEKGGDHA